MDRHPELDDATAEALLAGRPEAVGEHPELADLLGDLRVAYRPDLAPVVLESPTAASAIDDVELSEPPRSATMTRPPARRVARVLVGALVALLATGGLAVAGALPSPVQHAVSTAADDVGVELPDTEEPVVDEDPESEEPSLDGEAPANHGQEVSELARTTELEGCEKGRAVSALASGREVDERKPCPHADDEATDEDADGDDSEDESDAVEAPEADESHGSGHGRSADAPGHAERD